TQGGRGSGLVERSMSRDAWDDLRSDGTSWRPSMVSTSEPAKRPHRGAQRHIRGVAGHGARDHRAGIRNAGDTVRAHARGARFAGPPGPLARHPPASLPSVELRDVCRLEALRALCHLELHTLTLLERPESGAADGAVVHEDVLALIRGDEAVPLLAVEPLDLTLCQGTSPSLCCCRAAPDVSRKGFAFSSTDQRTRRSIAQRIRRRQTRPAPGCASRMR